MQLHQHFLKLFANIETIANVQAFIVNGLNLLLKQLHHWVKLDCFDIVEDYIYSIYQRLVVHNDQYVILFTIFVCADFELKVIYLFQKPVQRLFKGKLVPSII